MFLNPDEISTSIGWLLKNASPPVKYLTYKHLLDIDPQCRQMQELWTEVENSRAAAELFSAQNEDGSWFSGGPWGPRGYRQQIGPGYTLARPKFVTTAWLLPFLGEMGFTAADARIRRSCEYMLQQLGRDAGVLGLPSSGVNCCGLAAIPLRAFASVGMAGDERLQAGWARLGGCQRDDGGWLNPHHLADSATPSQTKGRWPWQRSCAWGSFYAVQALYYAGPAHAPGALPRALAFLRWHLSQKDSQHMRTWVYHGHNIVNELLMFSEAGFDLRAPPMWTLLEWLKGYYRPHEGVFRTQEQPIPDFVRHVSAIVSAFERQYGADYWTSITKTSAPVLRYHLYHLVEDDWLTYILTKIARNMTQTRHEGASRMP